MYPNIVLYLENSSRGAKLRFQELRGGGDMRQGGDTVLTYGFQDFQRGGTRLQQGEQYYGKVGGGGVFAPPPPHTHTYVHPCQRMQIVSRTSLSNNIVVGSLPICSARYGPMALPLRVAYLASILLLQAQSTIIVHPHSECWVHRSKSSQQSI